MVLSALAMEADGRDFDFAERGQEKERWFGERRALLSR